jgi:hypothetical protein
MVRPNGHFSCAIPRPARGARERMASTGGDVFGACGDNKDRRAQRRSDPASDYAR